jgi:hypothetical protein
MLQGNSETDILETIATHFPQAEPRALIQEVMIQISNSGNVDPQIVKGFVFESARELYRRMLEIGDFANALKALKLLHDIAT